MQPPEAWTPTSSPSAAKARTRASAWPAGSSTRQACPRPTTSRGTPSSRGTTTPSLPTRARAAWSWRRRTARATRTRASSAAARAPTTGSTLAQGAPRRQLARPLGDAQHRRRRRVHRRGGREGLGAQRPAAPPPAPPLGSGEATPRGEKAGRPSGSGSARQRAAAPRRRPLRGPAATPPRRARRGADGATTGTAAGMRGADGAREARGIEDGGADGQRHRSEAPPQQKNTGCVDRGRSVRRASTATKKKGRAVLRPRQHPTGGAPPQAAPQL